MAGLGRQPVLFAVLVLVACWAGAGGTCEGNSCAGQHAQATAAGLLGGSAPFVQGAADPAPGSDSCKQQTYPRDGSKLQPVEFPTPVLDLRWSGQPHEADKFVFALTQPSDGALGGHLFRSDKFGASDSWTDVTPQLEGAGGEGEGAERALAGVVELHFHHSHPAKLLAQGAGRRHWVSHDWGATWRPIATPGATLGYGSDVRLHPNQPDWVLAKVQRNECVDGERGPATPGCGLDLFVTQDFGSTWTNLTAKSGGRIAAFWDYEWGSVLHWGSEGPIVDETIFATVYESAAAMKGPYPGWDTDIHFVVSHDFFNSEHEKLVPCGNQFEVVAKQVFLAMPAECPVNPDGSKRELPPGVDRGASVSLWVSHDEAATFQQACLPVRDLDLGYNLVRTHDNAGAFVIVDHDEDDPTEARAPMSFVYAPGLNSSLFTLAMRRNFRRGYVADFVRVEGLPGVYLANQLDAKYAHDPAFRPRSEDDYAAFAQSQITFNGGAKWQGLAVPAHYRHAQCNGCSNLHDAAACKLHLHGPSAWRYGPGARPSFYSHSAAPGVVFAVGNTGEYLDPAAAATCTWLSGDGGLTWADVAPAASIYELGDHGGLLLLAQHSSEAPTDRLFFSLDEGACWHAIQLAEAISIDNIRVEPQGASHVFMVHGEACLRSEAQPTCSQERAGVRPPGKLYVVDIKAIMAADWRDCGEADYETWSLPVADMCLLGQNYSMPRRKPGAACFNGLDSVRGDMTAQPCPCATPDWECEYGYEFVDHDCRKMEGLPSRSCQALESGAYQASQTGRRLVHGDQCADVARIIPDTDGNGHSNTHTDGGDPKKKADDEKGHSGWATFFILLLVTGVVVLVVGVWWSRFASEDAKASIQERLEGVAALAGAAWGALADCVAAATERISGLAARREAEGAFFRPLAGADGLALDEEDARSPPLFPSRS